MTHITDQQPERNGYKVCGQVLCEQPLQCVRPVFGPVKSRKHQRNDPEPASKRFHINAKRSQSDQGYHDLRKKTFMERENKPEQIRRKENEEMKYLSAVVHFKPVPAYAEAQKQGQRMQQDKFTELVEYKIFHCYQLHLLMFKIISAICALIINKYLLKIRTCVL
jgi:hypothetical protein